MEEFFTASEFYTDAITAHLKRLNLSTDTCPYSGLQVRPERKPGVSNLVVIEDDYAMATYNGGLVISLLSLLSPNQVNLEGTGEVNIWELLDQALVIL